MKPGLSVLVVFNPENIKTCGYVGELHFGLQFDGWSREKSLRASWVNVRGITYRTVALYLAPIDQQSILSPERQAINEFDKFIANPALWIIEHQDRSWIKISSSE